MLRLLQAQLSHRQWLKNSLGRLKAILLAVLLKVVCFPSLQRLPLPQHCLHGIEAQARQQYWRMQWLIPDG